MKRGQAVSEAISHYRIISRLGAGGECEAGRIPSEANNVTTTERGVITTNVTRSVGLTPYSKPDKTRVNAKEPANSIATPATASLIPCPITILSTSGTRAPNAMRRPISRDRCVTEYDITP